ncbi:MAG: hypothetical protein AAGA44_03570 [Pseudomonadota bacterium]
MTHTARKFFLAIAVVFFTTAVEAKTLEFPEFNFRITLDSGFKVKSRYKRIAAEGGDVFDARSRKLKQSFSCMYQPLPEGLSVDNPTMSRMLLSRFAQFIGETHSDGDGPIGEPRFETRAGIDFYRFRMDSGLPSKEKNTVAFYHLFLRGNWFLACGSYHVPGEGEPQDVMADSIEPLDNPPTE